jgi:hypothetical protein
VNIGCKENRNSAASPPEKRSSFNENDTVTANKTASPAASRRALYPNDELDKIR